MGTAPTDRDHASFCRTRQAKIAKTTPCTVAGLCWIKDLTSGVDELKAPRRDLTRRAKHLSDGRFLHKDDSRHPGE